MSLADTPDVAETHEPREWLVYDPRNPHQIVVDVGQPCALEVRHSHWTSPAARARDAWVAGAVVGRVVTNAPTTTITNLMDRL